MFSTKPLLFFIAAALIANGAIAQEQPWAFVQSAGGMRVGQPLKRANGWVLPVTADVSGLNTITMQPSKVNIALACRETKAQLEGPSIYITLVTGPKGPGADSRCPPVFIANVLPGRYAVFYRSAGQAPVALGDVKLANNGR